VVFYGTVAQALLPAAATLLSPPGAPSADVLLPLMKIARRH